MFEPIGNQKDVIEASRSNILVSAAAGSGKTTVLSARITSKIVRKELRIDQLLVVTFTNDAAANMREKIEDSFRKAMSVPGVDKEYISEQIDMLPGSYIQTMNSFCNRVVSESGHMSESSDVMEPGSQVLDDTTLKMLRAQAAHEAVMQLYDGIADGSLPEKDREDFLNLVFSTGDGKKEGPLEESVIESYLKLRSLPDYITILDGIVDQRQKTDDLHVITGLARYVHDQDELLRKAYAACLDSEPMIPTITLKDESKDILKEIVASFKTNLEEYNNAFSGEVTDEEKLALIRRFYKSIYDAPHPSEYPRLYNKKEEIDPDFKDAFGPIAALCLINRKNHIHNGEDLPRTPNGYTNYGNDLLPNEDFDILGWNDADELYKMQLRRTSCARAFASLLKRMDDIYSRIKRKLHGIDYSDQEHMCLKVLKSPEARSFYKDKFKEIYIDEYQDNTSLQDSVVALIADDNVFCVGDVKQSIYKFRNANPSLFISKADSYRKDKSKGNLIELNLNFRSTPQILDFVNEVFGQLMSGGAAEIDYEGENHMLNAFDKTPPGNIPEVIFINARDKKSGSDSDDQSDDNVSDEQKQIKDMELLTFQIGKKVRDYLDSGYSYKDIFVLTRTNNAARAAADFLRSKNIPARCIDSKPLFSDNEIIGICNLIKVLANEYRDECLTGVMLSAYRFSNFKLDELAEIISYNYPEYKEMNLIVKIRNYSKTGPDEEIKKKCNFLCDALNELRSDSVVKDIGELIEDIFIKTGIKATLMKESSSEIEKLNVFKNWLISNFLKRGSDLSEVSSVIEQMQSRLDDSTAIEYDLGGEDLVRCLSYHKSKGLERKCVIVADVDPSNRKDTDSFISFKTGNTLSPYDPAGPRFVIDDYDEERVERFTSGEMALIREENKLESNAEDMRLLYVALTRARNELCFIRRINLSSETLDESVFKPILKEGRHFSREYYLKCSGIYKLMLSALLRMKLSSDSSDLLSICTPDEKPSYRSPFEGVRLSIVSEAEYDGAAADDTTGSSDQGNEDKSSDKKPEYVIHGCSGKDDNGLPVFDHYKYEDAMYAPAKTSVSSLKQDEEASDLGKELSDDGKSDDESSEMRVAINLTVPDAESYIGIKGSLSGASLGTAVHKTMSFIDLKSIMDGTSVKEELDLLVKDGILSADERKAVNRFADNIVLYAKTDLCRSFVKADESGKAFRERPLTCSIRIAPDRDDYTLVQGTLDAMYIDEDGKAVIIDYKTDYIKTDDTDAIVTEVKRRHSEQIELYAAAVEASGIPVKKRYVYLLRKNMAIEI